MVITVRFFAAYADNLGTKETDVTLGETASVTDVLASVASMPGAGTLPRNPIVAVNHVYASADTKLSPGDEVALIPPVAGG